MTESDLRSLGVTKELPHWVKTLLHFRLVANSPSGRLNTAHSVVQWCQSLSYLYYTTFYFEVFCMALKYLY